MKGMFEKLTEHINTENLNPQSTNELRELLKQIDNMVSRKRDDWQLQYDKLTEKLKLKDEVVSNNEREIMKLKEQLTLDSRKIDRYETDRNITVRNYESTILDLREKLRQAKAIGAKTSSLNHTSNTNSSTSLTSSNTTITRLNKELLKEKEKYHQLSVKHDEIDIKNKVNLQKISNLEKQNNELLSRLKMSEKQGNSYQNQLRRANRMLSDLERSSQALVSRLESELMKDKRLLQQQENLNKSLQNKLDVSDQKNFTYEKEIKVLKQRNEELSKNLNNTASGLQSGLSTLAPSGLATPLILANSNSNSESHSAPISATSSASNFQNFVNPSDTPSPSNNSTPKSNLSSEQQHKLQIERSKLIRYAKELRKRVSDRDSKIISLSENLSEINQKYDQLKENYKLKNKENQDLSEHLEHEIKSLTNTISRANSETMHYRRDLENIQLEISTISKQLMLESADSEDGGKIPLLKSANNIECLDELLLQIYKNFTRKKSPHNFTEVSMNTDLDLTQLTEIIESARSKTPPEVITPRMEDDMNQTVDTGLSRKIKQAVDSNIIHGESHNFETSESSSKSLSHVVQQKFPKLRSFKTKFMPTKLNFNDNPSLTQDINEIFRSENMLSAYETSEESDKSDLENVGPFGDNLPNLAAQKSPRNKILTQKSFNHQQQTDRQLQLPDQDVSGNHHKNSNSISDQTNAETLPDENPYAPEKRIASSTQSNVQHKVIATQNAGPHPEILDASAIFDPNQTMSLLDNMNKKETEEINKLDTLLQTHIDNFLAETADLF